MRQMTARALFLLPSIFLLGLASCERPADQPHLLVLVVVDQLGASLLDRYGDALTGGFSRLRIEGTSFPHTVIAHAVTNSGPGHATAITGAHPAHHGIVGNGWMEQTGEGWRYRSASLDTTVAIVGFPDQTARSPRARLTEGLGDWALDHDPNARAVAIGQGATSANAMAQLRDGEAYWFSTGAGQFVTSTYYRTDYPEWVERFNRQALPRLMADSVWQQTTSDELRARALPDDVPWEQRDGTATFPHTFASDVREADRAEPSAFSAWFGSTPMIDVALLELARAAIRANDLGQRDATDVVALNLSSLDEAGHRYGPWSQEQLDALYRLDQGLDAFLRFLDEEVGPGRWALALTADHGVADPPEQSAAEGRPGTRVTLETMDSLFDSVRALASRPGAAPLAERAAAFLEAQPFVADVFSIDELMAPGPTDDDWLDRYRLSFRPDRILDFPLYDRRGETSLAELGIGAVRLTEGTIVDFATAVHGSPYEYDRVVPFFLIGPGIPGGGERDGAWTVDVAPTLAELGGTPLPGGLDGRSLVDEIRGR